MTFYDDDHVQRYQWTTAEIEEAEKELSADCEPVSDWWREKYYSEVSRNWDLFYRRNETRFFKDRMWLEKEFGSLEVQNGLVLDIGAGVGNALFPLLRDNPQLSAVAVDCSSRAIDFIRKRWTEINFSGGSEEVAGGETTSHESARWEGGVLRAAEVWDVSLAPVPPSIVGEGGADVILLLFVLSAVPPGRIAQAVRNCAECLREGGVILFRDYGKLDVAQLRFARHRRSKLQEDTYVRQDGTLCHYFTTNELCTLFCELGGLEKLELEEQLREFTNRKTGVKLRRVWLQGKFRKQRSVKECELL